MSRSFNGSSDNILLKFSALGRPFVAATIFKTANPASGTSYVIGRGGNWALDISTSGNIRFWVQTDYAFRETGSYNLANNIWYRVAGYYASNGVLRLYVNGVMRGSNSNSLNARTNATDGRIGSATGGTSSYFSGLIAQVQINTLFGYPEPSSVVMYRDWLFPGSFRDGIRGFLPLFGTSPEIDVSGYTNLGTVNGALVDIDPPDVYPILNPYNSQSMIQTTPRVARYPRFGNRLMADSFVLGKGAAAPPSGISIPIVYQRRRSMGVA